MMSRKHARASNVVAFSQRQASTLPPVTSVASLSVEIRYLHHREPHHRDSDVQRVEKARVSAAAKSHEGTVEIEYPKGVEYWTADDIVAVIDQVRSDMPVVSPVSADERTAGECWLDPADTFRDGRGLLRVHFDRAYRHGRVVSSIWFSTAAGYSARIMLDGALPASALVPFATAHFPFFSLFMDLDVRALRRSRRQATVTS